jgi:serine/threonine-protein kinase
VSERPDQEAVVGRYVLHDEIASGGMASVHLGRLIGPAGFARTVAVKRLHPEHARDPEFVAMFLDEARLAARIRHPNVVPIVDVVALSGQLFLVMEYIEGESFSRLIQATNRASARIPEAVALTVVTDALYGLHAAHQASDERGEPLSIVHRDVSPHNILVGRDGVSRVLDFGIAKAASRASTTRDGKVKGKFAYMAPEQLRRGPVDRRADVFAAAIVLWEALTHERLFAADDLAGVVARVLNDRIDPPSRIVRSVSRELDAIVMTGLEREPERRYSTAMEMARAIEALGGLARPAEVGAWVDSISGDVLKRRAAQVQEIEQSDGSGGAVVETRGPVPFIPPTLAPSPRAAEPTLQLEEPEGLTEQHRAIPPAADPTRPLPVKRRAEGRKPLVIAASLVALALLLAGVGAARWGSSEAPAPRASPPEAPPVSTREPEPSTAESEPSAAPEPPEPRVESAPSSAEKSARHPRVRRPKHTAKADCTPNYYFDADGIKRFKPECL